MDRIRCEKCKAESFYSDTTKIFCVSCHEEASMKGQAYIDSICHYRNLAIELGARPEQMTNSFDKQLCEKWNYYKSRPDEADFWKDEYPEAWEFVDKLEAENAELKRRLKNLEQHFLNETIDYIHGDRMPYQKTPKLGL